MTEKIGVLAVCHDGVAPRTWSHMAGVTDSLDKANEIQSTLMDAVGRYKGYVITGNETDDERRERAYTEARKFDPWFDDNVTHYIVVPVNDYDGPRSPLP